MSDAESFAAHVSSRVRGMKGQLLSEAEMNTLLEQQKNPEGLAQALLSTNYANEIAESLTRYQGADAVEDGVTRNLVNTFERLLRASGGEYRALAKIFITRWDLVSIKSLLRQRHHGLDADDSIFPGPSMPVALLRELGSQKSMDSLVRGLAAWNPNLCRGMEEKLGEYQSSKDLRVLEEALDRSYFLNSMRRLSGAELEEALFVKDVLAMEIDRINLRTLLEARAEGVSPDELVRRTLPRGRLSESVLRELAAASTFDRALPILEKTPYVAIASDAAESATARGFSGFERFFEMAILQRLKRAAQHEGLGIALLMHYAWLKYNEVMNLRMIARGLDIHLAPSRIREEMVYV